MAYRGTRRQRTIARQAGIVVGAGLVYLAFSTVLALAVWASETHFHSRFLAAFLLVQVMVVLVYLFRDRSAKKA